MCPRNETVVLVQERLRVEVLLGAVQDDGSAVIDLNCVNTVAWSNRPIYFHM